MIKPDWRRQMPAKPLPMLKMPDVVSCPALKKPENRKVHCFPAK